MKINTNEPIAEVQFSHNGKTFSVLIPECDKPMLYDMITSLDLKKAEQKPKKKTGFERVKIGCNYYIANDDFPYVDDRDEDFDQKNYETANYFNTKELALNMSRAINLFSKLTRCAVEHDTVGDVNNVSYSIHYTGSGFDVEACADVACAPAFSSAHIAKMAIEEFREDLVWYFTEFLPGLKEGKYV